MTFTWVLNIDILGLATGVIGVGGLLMIALCSFTGKPLWPFFAGKVKKPKAEVSGVKDD